MKTIKLEVVKLFGNVEISVNPAHIASLRDVGGETLVKMASGDEYVVVQSEERIQQLIDALEVKPAPPATPTIPPAAAALVVLLLLFLGFGARAQSLPPAQYFTNWVFWQVLQDNYPYGNVQLGADIVTVVTTNSSAWPPTILPLNFQWSTNGTTTNGSTILNGSDPVIFIRWTEIGCTRTSIQTNWTIPLATTNYDFTPYCTNVYSGPYLYDNWMEVTALSTNSDPSQQLRFFNNSLNTAPFLWVGNFGQESIWHFINGTQLETPGWGNPAAQFWDSYSYTTHTNGKIHATIWQHWLNPATTRTNFDNLYPQNRWVQ